ncbi:MAG: hypothetical protein DCC75_00680 [Proteobacteria bacterium]|nr:MAG: hypothetical protein DCC75_00680 [Pseudomonadota bacterium]
MTEFLSLKEIEARLNQPQHVLIHLCEKEVVVPEVETSGRGRWRQFSPKNLLEFAVALELRKYEIPIAVIRVMTRILSSFEKAMRRAVPSFELPGALVDCGPEVELYLYGGQYAAFVLGKKSIVGFDIEKILKGDAKQTKVEKLKSLPSQYGSYLWLSLSAIARRVA